MESKIKELFSTIVEVPIDILYDDSSPENIENWDSFKHLMLVAAFEEEFDVSFEPEEIIRLYKDYKTFKDAVLQKL